jgi:hypothetical protein
VISPVIVRGTTQIVSLSRPIWKPWSHAVTVTTLRAWIIPMWIFWVATMMARGRHTRAHDACSASFIMAIQLRGASSPSMMS